ncbi:flagellar biosynthetic protein FliO [Bacillus timonensis]|nr:flagellar biosynthetic protein FliO [Bacillus timonensis]
MLQRHKFIFFICIFFLILVNMTQPVNANTVNKTVNDFYKQPPNEEIDSEKEKNTLTDEPPVDITTTELTFWDFLKMIFATIFVIGLIYFFLKFINKKNRLFTQYKHLENLGGTSLGTNRSIQMIKVGDRILVVGVGENIQLLKEIDNEDEMNQILDDHNSRLEQLIQPRDIVNRFIERRKGTDKNSNDFSIMFRSQLSELAKGRKDLVNRIEQKGTDRE